MSIRRLVGSERRLSLGHDIHEYHCVWHYMTESSIKPDFWRKPNATRIETLDDNVKCKVHGEHIFKKTKYPSHLGTH